MIKSLLYLVLALSIKCRCCLIEQKQLRFANEGSSDGDTLLLASRKFDTTLTNHCIVLKWEQVFIMNEVVSTCLTACIVQTFLNLFIIEVHVVQAVAYVFTNRARKQNRFLLHDTDLLMIPLWIKLLNVDSIEEDFAFVRVIKALNKRNDR